MKPGTARRPRRSTEWRTGNPACPDRQDCLSSTATMRFPSIVTDEAKPSPVQIFPLCRCSRALTLVALHLLGEVVLQADLLDQRELGLEPVDVFLLVFEDLLEQAAGVVVAELAAGLDALVEARQRFHLQGVIGLEDLVHVL